MNCSRCKLQQGNKSHIFCRFLIYAQLNSGQLIGKTELGVVCLFLFTVFTNGLTVIV